MRSACSVMVEELRDFYAWEGEEATVDFNRKAGGWYSSAVMAYALRHLANDLFRLDELDEAARIDDPDIVGMVVNFHGVRWKALRNCGGVIWLLGGVPEIISRQEYGALVESHPTYVVVSLAA